jgi:hypothetical protein
MLLKLGYCDHGSVEDSGDYLSRWHDWKLPDQGFRLEETGSWTGAKNLSESPVRELQERLRRAGFYPKGALDGIYGYRTQSAVRLFQEHVLTIERREEIGDVDGIAGDKTQKHLDRWLASGLTPAWGEPTAEYRSALDGLRTLQQHFTGSDQKGIRLLEENAEGSASRKVADWTYRDEDFHIVGIRRNENEVFDTGRGTRRRRNDDVIVLLINGTRWVFRGSTNPSPNMPKPRREHPFLLRGQHEYRFGWHKIGGTEQAPGRSKVYRAYKPRPWHGPLTVRAVGDLLTDESFEDAEKNPGINIHWSGSGTANWSAGCQVVAGAKYLDFRNELVDASHRAAAGYGQLSGGKTRGAYNVFVDLTTIFADDPRPVGDTLLYTLLYERDARHTEAGSLIDFDEVVARLS